MRCYFTHRLHYSQLLFKKPFSCVRMSFHGIVTHQPLVSTSSSSYTLPPRCQLLYVDFFSNPRLQTALAGKNFFLQYQVNSKQSYHCYIIQVLIDWEEILFIHLSTKLDINIIIGHCINTITVTVVLENRAQECSKTEMARG